MSKTKVSIITVALNDREALDKTIESILNQTYDNFELIVIDGGSTDGSLDIIKKYEASISHWISEHDNGIYDAMNKGIDLASGEWLNFMNAGDTFYSNSTLSNSFNEKDITGYDILFGDTVVIYPNKTRIAEAGKIEKLWKGSQFCHQSCFISSSLHKAYKFNIVNKISADFEFFYHRSINHTTFKNLGIIVSSITSGGISDTNRIDSIVSHWNIVDKSIKINIYYLWIILKEMFKEKLKYFFKSNPR